MKRLIAQLFALLLAFSATASHALLQYKWDNGTPQFSTPAFAHQILVIGFQATAPNTTIQSIDFKSFWTGNNNKGVTYYLWSDPTNDGNPADAVLQRSVTGTLVDANWHSYAITPYTLNAGDWFYVGVGLDDSTFSYFLGATDTQSNNGNSHLFSWTGGNTQPGALSSGTKFTLDANLLLRATGVAQFTVTPSAGTGGTVGAAATVLEGQTANIAITANAGYQTITPVGGTCGGTLAGNTYTTNPVTANCTVVASFLPLPIAPTTQVSPANSGSLQCTTPASFGATSTCTATPQLGYALATISGCGGTPSASNTYVTAPITASCAVIATFVALPPTVVPSLSAYGLLVLVLLMGSVAMWRKRVA